MRRRRAVQFFGGLTVAIIGYVAWCSREMYLPPGIPDLSDVPEDALPLVLQEIARTGFGKPEKFRLKTFLYRLSDPLDPHPVQLDVMVRTGDRILGVRDDYMGAVFYLEEKNGRWVVMDPKDWGRNR